MKLVATAVPLARILEVTVAPVQSYTNEFSVTVKRKETSSLTVKLSGWFAPAWTIAVMLSARCSLSGER